MQAKGNAAFSSGKFEEAISHFTKGIEADGTNHVLYSNRSAAQVLSWACVSNFGLYSTSHLVNQFTRPLLQASLGNFKEALEDAKKVV